jgi:hypothetical protein
MKLPFEAEATGKFNGDMFYDWYTHKPTDKKELYFWDFLHSWEKNILLKANANLFAIIEKYIREQV